MFSGPEDSCIAQWIRQFSLGFKLDSDFIGTIPKLLSKQDEVKRLKENALGTYKNHFSRKVVVSGFLECINSQEEC